MNKNRITGTGLPGRSLLALVLLAVFQLSLAQDFVWAPDLPVGSTLPEIAAEDQNGELRRFEDLKGENGMLFMLSRSFGLVTCDHSVKLSSCS